MNSSNRDLLVLSKKSSFDPQEMELEVQKLHQLLFIAESFVNFCVVNEIIDLNSYKIIDDPIKIERKIRQKKLKPFEFISNKN